MIELIYKMEPHDEDPYKNMDFRKYFKTWESLDKFIQSRKIKTYKVKGESKNNPDQMINYTSVQWEEYGSNTKI